VERETAVARKLDADAEKAIEQDWEDFKICENMGLKGRKPKETFEEEFNAIADSLGNRSYSDDYANGKVEKDDADDSELGKLSKHD